MSGVFISYRREPAPRHLQRLLAAWLQQFAERTLAEAMEEILRERQRQRELIRQLAEAPVLVVLVGAHNSGKTTMLSALLGAAERAQDYRQPPAAEVYRALSCLSWSRPAAAPAGGQVCVCDIPGIGESQLAGVDPGRRMLGRFGVGLSDADFRMLRGALPAWRQIASMAQSELLNPYRPRAFVGVGGTGTLVAAELGRQLSHELIDGSYRIGEMAQWVKRRLPRPVTRTAIAPLVEPGVFRLRDPAATEDDRRDQGHRSTVRRTLRDSGTSAPRPSALGSIPTVVSSRSGTCTSTDPLAKVSQRAAMLAECRCWANLTYGRGALQTGDPSRRCCSTEPCSSRNASKGGVVRAVRRTSAGTQTSVGHAKRTSANASSVSAAKERPRASYGQHTLGSRERRRYRGCLIPAPAEPADLTHDALLAFNWASFDNTITIESGRVGVG